MSTDEIQIAEIIHSFDTYCLGDIKHNRTAPIALFMLSMCWVDTLGALCYNTWLTAKRWEDFVTNYMKEYAGLDMYNICRNNLIHSYTSNKKYAISYDPLFAKPHDMINGRLVINPLVFADTLEAAYNNIKKELLIPASEIRNNALLWDTAFPILRAKNI